MISTRCMVHAICALGVREGSPSAQPVSSPSPGPLTPYRPPTCCSLPLGSLLLSGATKAFATPLHSSAISPVSG